MKIRNMSKRDDGKAMFRYWLIFGIMVSIVLGGAVFSTQVEAAGAIIYVDHDAEPGGDGSDWFNAYTDLQDAIDAAVSGDQIFVADGTYYPTGNGTGRDVHFTMKNGVSIIGGWNGLQGFGNETILSGNIGDPNSSADNAYHVISTSGLDNTAVLSGVTIEGGRANGAYPHSFGGGIFNDGSSPTLQNVVIQNNFARYGGGVANINGSRPVLTNMEIRGNHAYVASGGGVGGGIYNLNNSDPRLTNVLISGNLADDLGGGIFNLDGSDPVLTNVTVSGNKADSGGGMRNNSNDNHPIVRNSIFSSNGGGNWTNVSGSTVTVDVYSIVSSDASPLFVDPISSAAAPTTGGDYRLKAGAAAIDVGSNSYYDSGSTPDLSGITFDLDGKPRKINSIVDIGAFEYDYLNIAVAADPIAGGAVTGDGIYEISTVATVTASVYDGYTFVNWTEAGMQVSTNASYAFMVNSNRTLTANFEPIMHDIAVTADPVAGGTVSGGGSVQETQEATVTANANDGYAFVNWTEGGMEVSTEASYTFTVTGDRSLTANFEAIMHDIAVTADPVGWGTVSGGGSVQETQEATVTANANDTYTFVNWTESGVEVSREASYTFTVTGDRTLTANFEPIMHDISVTADPVAGGTVSGGGSVQETQEATVTANANAGYAFVNWTEGGMEVSTEASYTFTVTGDRSLTANFEAIKRDIAVTADPLAWGTVSGGGSVQETQEATVTANANAGYAFVNWTEGGMEVSTEASYTFTVTGDRTLTANFEAIMHDIAVTADPVGWGTVSGGGSVQETQEATVTANANAGYAFVNWTEGGMEVSTEASYTFTVTGDRSLTANFEAIMYDITVTADPSVGGSVSGDGSVQEKTETTVTATANAGYTFVNWTENGTEVSTEASYTFTVTGDRTLTANFEAETPTPPSSPPPQAFVCDNLCYFKGLYTANMNLQVRWQQPDLDEDNFYLNWTGTVDSDELAYYILFRDGQEIYRGLETDYTDNILSKGSYLYTLFIVNSAGERSYDSMLIWTNGHFSVKYTVNVDRNQSYGLGELTLNFTAGNWTQHFELSMEDATAQSQALVPESSPLVSPIYQLLKSFEGRFQKPLELQFIYDADLLPKGMVPAIHYFDEDTDQWIQLNGTIEGNTISAQTDHFTNFAVLAVKKKVEFSDIAEHWAEQAIQHGAELDLIHGFPDGTFRPDESVTRAQFAAMLANTLDAGERTGELLFKDAALIPAYAVQPLTYMVQEGIIHGYPDGTLKPNNEITREEMAVMLAAALKLKLNDSDKTSFRDDDRISPFAYPSVISVVQSGYLKGRDQNLFAPQSTLTRAEAVVLMLRIFDNQILGNSE